MKLKELRCQKFTTYNLDSINLLIIRDTFTENSTIGKLYLNGEQMCDTLENPYLDNQKNISCIPAGEYKVRIRVYKVNTLYNRTVETRSICFKQCYPSQTLKTVRDQTFPLWFSRFGVQVWDQPSEIRFDYTYTIYLQEQGNEKERN